MPVTVDRPFIPSHCAPTHPGEMLLEEFMKPNGWDLETASKKLEIPLETLTGIVVDHESVTNELARKLAKVLGMSSEFWINLQIAHDRYAFSKNE